MGTVVLDFIRGMVVSIINLMKDTVIFDPYPPFFDFSLTLWDVFIGTLTVSLVMKIFGFDYDDDDEYEDEETQIF